jgi:hypothetical protein
MATMHIHDLVEGLEKANANLDPDLLTTESARRLLDEYARAEKLAAYGRTTLAARIDDAKAVARATGTSMGRAKQTLETGAALKDAPEVGDALARGDVSLDQAAEIAKAEQASPGSAGELLEVAKKESFNVLRDQSRRVSSRPNSTGDLETGSGRRGRPGATPTSSAWSTSTCASSPTSEPRS